MPRKPSGGTSHFRDWILIVCVLRSSSPTEAKCNWFDPKAIGLGRWESWRSYEENSCPLRIPTLGQFIVRYFNEEGPAWEPTSVYALSEACSLLLKKSYLFIDRNRHSPTECRRRHGVKLSDSVALWIKRNGLAV